MRFGESGHLLGDERGGEIVEDVEVVLLVVKDQLVQRGLRRKVLTKSCIWVTGLIRSIELVGIHGASEDTDYLNKTLRNTPKKQTTASSLIPEDMFVGDFF